MSPLAPNPVDVHGTSAEWCRIVCSNVFITVSASGGPFGGSFTLTAKNLEKLIAANGPGPVPLPADMTLEPYETYSATFECAGVAASASENDVEVEGTFTEAVTGRTESPRARATVVRVELEVEDRPPQNPVPNRHIYGLREKFFCRIHPSDVGVKWTDSDPSLSLSGTADYFRCPWTNGEYIVSATLGDMRLDMPILVYAPTVECRSATWRDGIVGQPGTAGMVGMFLSLYLQPSTVSFANIWMREIPEYVAIPQSGYFTMFPGLLPLTHDVGAGAGVWRQPVMTSNGNYWCDDAAQMPCECPPSPGTTPPEWSEGTVRWMIPVGWGNNVEDVDRIRPNPTDQVFHMREDGTLSISKYTHVIMRSVDDRVWLDGSRVNAWWSGWFQ